MFIVTVYLYLEYHKADTDCRINTVLINNQAKNPDYKHCYQDELFVLMDIQYGNFYLTRK